MSKVRWNERFSAHVDHDRPQLVGQLARAQALADVVGQVPLPPRVQEKLHRLNIVRAVKGTTAVEGIELETHEIEAIATAESDEAILPPSRQTAEREGRNAFAAMRSIAHWLDENPDRSLDVQLINDLHQTLTDGLDYAGNVPGQYRDKEVMVGHFHPPAPDRVPELVRQFCDWLNSDEVQRWHPVSRAVLAHYYLASIHPFSDGNGRTARAVESFVLYKRDQTGGGINTRGFYSLANFYYRNRMVYFDHLDNVRTHPDQNATDLIVFAVNGLVEELETVSREVMQQVQVICFRDFARLHLSKKSNLRPSNRSRLLRFVLSLLDLQQYTPAGGVPLHSLREGEGLLAALYEEKSLATLRRDLKFLTEEKLVVVQEGLVKANLKLMTEFTVQ